MSAPIRMPANQPADRFYRGGSRIRDFRGSGAPGDRVPEDWVGSTTPLFGEESLGLTVIDGTMLRDLVDADPVGWLGPDHVARWGSNPALLVKLLDAGERLPVHLHPDREFAVTHLGSAFGKTEAWIALEPVTAWVGFSREITASEAARWVADQDTSAMLAAMTEVTIPRGSSIVIPAGVPHAIGEGAFVIELQEPTDFSVLMEWRGFEIDGASAGHLGLGFNTALAALDRSAWSASRVAGLIAPPGPLSPAADGYFRAELHHGGDTLDPGFCVLVVTRGAGTLGGHPLSKGETWVIPFSAGQLTLAGDVEAVRCRPPV
ncbi:class I mannose-6-phosphate isomerase [soil metagenome]